MSNKFIYYFVEGECEEKFINTFKFGNNQIFPTGKVQVFNVVNKRISKAQVISLKENSKIFFVYDIDTGNVSILEDNLSLFAKYGFNNIKHIQSINNFEEELIYSTSLTKIQDFSKGISNLDDFKYKFINHKNLISKLSSLNFDENKIWSRVSLKGQFGKYSSIDDIKSLKIK